MSKCATFVPSDVDSTAGTRYMISLRLLKSGVRHLTLGRADRGRLHAFHRLEREALYLQEMAIWLTTRSNWGAEPPCPTITKQVEFLFESAR